ncbi:MAG: (2Fe-2S)-binding protein [Desulfobacterales bacterium]|nr:(2Fe-2S)-binding protein [Desulfobacterales bacterium]
MKTIITLNINQEACELAVAPNQTLLDVLRDDLALTGSKKGCDSGACGACTVIIDGEPVLGCMTLAIRCQGKQITTIEGLCPGGKLHPLQQAALDHNAVQCGFCTPGWILAAKVLLENNPRPSREEVQRGISGNLCRCTGYKKIEEAILSAAER